MNLLEKGSYFDSMLFLVDFGGPPRYGFLTSFTFQKTSKLPFDDEWRPRVKRKENLICLIIELESMWARKSLNWESIIE